MAAAVVVVALALYLGGVIRLRQRGENWPALRTVGFIVLGVGSYALVQFSFLGVFSADLRYAFTTRIALLLLVVPVCMSSGLPLGLLRANLGEVGNARIDRVLRTRLVRLFGNAIFATLFSAAVFALFLTHLSWLARGNPVVQDALSVVIPLVGLLMVIPIAENTAGRTTMFVTIEFLFAFAELLIDAIPGIVMRLSAVVLDGAPVIHLAYAWWPSALRDQQLSGDILWFIAEAADIPVLVLLFIRWSRSDKRDAKQYDDLTDDEYDELTRAHLEGRAD